MKIRTGTVVVDAGGRVRKSPEVTRDVPDTWMTDMAAAIKALPKPATVDGKLVFFAHPEVEKILARSKH